MSIIDVLPKHRPRRFLVNAEALGVLKALGLSTVRHRQVGQLQRKWILDATAVAAYHADVEFPVVRLLVCDDAPQFTLVTEELALCWVHEGRHYKKLLPSISRHRALVEAFVQRFWLYSDQLLAYRKQPTPAEATRLAGE